MTTVSLSGIGLRGSWSVPLPPRTQHLIDKIVELAPLRDGKIDPKRAEEIAIQHEEAELYILADQIRANAGILIHPHCPSPKWRRQNRRAIEAQILAALGQHKKLSPNEVCELLGKTHAQVDKILARMKRNGKIIILAHKFYSLPGKEQD